ncbi:MAG: SH3 domain-containing protein, partial [Chloroflexota bacterium]|nr:SH3 domain-containing protein [Chloroflexota bacterium]
PPRTPTGGLPPLTNTAPIPRGGLRLPIVGIVALLVVLIGGVGIALFGRDILGGVTETATPPATATLTEIPIVIVPTTSDTATSVPSVTPTASATQTLTLTLTETPAPTFTPTPTDTPTFTPSLTLTPTETPSLTLTPSLTPTDTETPTATLTPTPTETPSPTPTATPATPIAFGVRPLIARVGPEPRFPVMATIAAELALDIIGISEDGQWIQVAFKDGSIGWIAFAAASLQTAGDLRLIPVALPPTDTPTATITPSVTPTPTLTLTPSDTPSPTNKPTVTPTFTETPSSTPIPSSTPTDMPSFTPSWTPSHTPTLTLTATATATFTETPTPTESPTFTLTPRPTPTPTRTRTPVPSRTPTPAYTFQIGETVVVFALDDDGLALRQRPSRSAGLMDLLPTRTILTVIGGPVESENLTWWELRMENRLTGWAVEEADGVRTLRASGDPSLSPTSVICPGGRLPTRMVVGDYARVLEDDARPLNIRSGAGTTFERIGQLLVNDVFLILDGPVCVGGLAWYRIQDNVNREGWIAEGDTAYFVEPVG